MSVDYAFLVNESNRSLVVINGAHIPNNSSARASNQLYIVLLLINQQNRTIIHLKNKWNSSTN